MFRTLAIGATLAAVLVVGVGVASARTETIPALKATVGPGFTITLKRNATKVKVLRAGSYKFVISDKASAHGFTLEQVKGGKWEKVRSPVGFVGSKTVTVKLKAGKWKFYCPAHESSMFGFFTVS